MSKEEKTALVPRLRFPEFKNSVEWNKKTFGDIFDYEQPTSYLVSSENYNEKFATPVLTAGKTFILGYTDEVTGVCNNLPVVIFDDFTTASKFVDFPFKAKSSAMKILRCKKSFNVVFAFNALQQVKYAVSVHERHWISRFSLIDTCVPTPKEQQKIADCLSSLDELIAAEDKKLLALRDHKNGLMQKLFPAESETVPEWRFPEFRNSGDWEETTIEKVLDYENGKAHENDIVASGKYIVVNSKFISTEGEIRKFTNTANLPANKGDILMVLSDVPNGRAIAKCYLVEKDNTYTVNQRVCRLISQKANRFLLFHLINRNSYFLAFDDGIKQTNLKKDDVLSCPLLLPKDLKEQQEIADVLSSTDELITAQSEKIEALKTHKKGMMQGLFLSIEEVEV